MVGVVAAREKTINKLESKDKKKTYRVRGKAARSKKGESRKRCLLK